MKAKPLRILGTVFPLGGSRIARLIFVSNLAGLAVLIMGALVLNETRSGLIIAKLQDLNGQAQAFANLLGNGATEGSPEPRLLPGGVRQQIAALSLPPTVRATVRGEDGRILADSFLLSDRVDENGLTAIAAPAFSERLLQEVSERLGAFDRIGDEVNGLAMAANIEGELIAASAGLPAASQRANADGRRVLSVSVPVQRVSAVVGTLTLESADIDSIVRAERVALIPFIIVALCVALLTSALLTLAVARPLKRLATAADKVRIGASQMVSLPKVSSRGDEIGELATAVEQMTKALSERLQANEAFAADVAHEMKNPLTSIRSAVETLELVKDNEAQSKTLRALITADVKRLDRLITDISNASRLEAEMGRTNFAPVEISGFAREVVDTYAALSSARESGRARSPVEFDDRTFGANLMVRARRGPLGQVLRNLIDNALSFSDGEAPVRVSVVQAAIGSQTTARLIVEDRGPGVPEDKLSTIFERFYTDRPEGAAFGDNSGLGLAIVRQIIASHDGAVFAENREGGGARFTVELPAY